MDLSQVKEWFIGGSEVSKVQIGDLVIWQKSSGPEPVLKDGICFEAVEPCTISFVKNAWPTAIEIIRSDDGDNWDDSNVFFWVNSGTGVCNTISLQPGQKTWLRMAKGYDGIFSSSTESYYNFTISGKVKISGSLRYLLSYDGSVKDVKWHQFNQLFAACDIVTGPDLDFDSVDNRGYRRVFYNCKYLSQYPLIKIKTLVAGCFNNLFAGSTPTLSDPVIFDMTECETVPSLPSTSVFSDCQKDYRVKVPSGLYDQWKNTTGWSSISSKIIHD